MKHRVIRSYQILVGSTCAAVGLSARLERHGVLVLAIQPPSVPEGTLRVRISHTAGHTEDDVRRLLELLRMERP